jgi:hypothetical protein
MSVRVVLLLAIAASVTAAAGADAHCTSSRPASRQFSDGAADAGLGLAPEVIGVRMRVDRACRLRVQPRFGDRGPTVGLFPNEGVVIYLDTDADVFTGARAWAGADVAVVSAGHLGAGDLGPALGRWNGRTFRFGRRRMLRDLGIGGFRATLGQLGVAAPAILRVRVGTSWVGLRGIHRDFAPDPGAPSYELPLRFT